MKIRTMKVNNLETGPDEIIVPSEAVKFAWTTSSEHQNDGQTAFELVINMQSGEPVYQSGVITTTANYLKLNQVDLPEHTTLTWQVRVTDRYQQRTPWSRKMRFTTAIKDWQAQWIEPIQPAVTPEPKLDLAAMFGGGHLPKQRPVDERLRPVQYLRRQFKLTKPVRQAQLFMTAHGIYQPLINGHRVTTAQFMPDFTSYQHVLQYQYYDVTKYLATDNDWQVLLADGWYAGRISTTGNGAQFGDKLGIFGEILVTYTDGTQSVIGTDNHFESTTGKYCYSDIFIGEKQDLRQQPDWENAQPVKVDHYALDNLVPQTAQYVRRLAAIPAKKVWRDGTAILVDFGQVIAGRTVLNIFLAANQAVKVEHAEVLDQAGHFFNNITGRNKDQTDYFIGRGQFERLEADFTFHGFRYIRLTGLTSMPKLTDMTAVPLMTAMPVTGDLTTSNPKINQLIKNVQWSQRGNMLSIPTDCPQRERAGWTGDTQVFAPTALFNQDVTALLKRWLISVRAEQREDGQIIDYSPAPKEFYTASPQFTGTYSSAGWGDAIIMVPWALYQAEGDRQALAENYHAMQAWHTFGVKSAAQGKSTDSDAQYVWDTKFHYGDWMFPSDMLGKDAPGPMATAKATSKLVGTAFLGYTSRLLSQIATLLGHDDEATCYQAYADKVAQAFQASFWDVEHQRLTSEYQGCYVLAVAFNLLDSTTSQQAVKHLVTMIHANNDCLDTGFLSMPYLLDVLEKNGYAEVAETVLLQTKLPSWLYEVDHGATTIWESWDGIAPDGHVGNYSFNHYAFGCVEHWIVEQIGGLKMTQPGYRTFTVTIPTTTQFTSARLSYQSTYGMIKSYWQRDELGTKIQLQVPFDTTATIRVGNHQLQLGSGSYNLIEDGKNIRIKG